MKNVCVLIPSYNEAANIGSIVKSLRNLGMAVYVVDDGSTDDTAAIAEREGAVVSRHEKNKGKGASIRDGFDYVVFNEFDYETARAKTVEEAEKLGQEGWTKYDQINEVHLYRRLKP